MRRVVQKTRTCLVSRHFYAAVPDMQHRLSGCGCEEHMSQQPFDFFHDVGMSAVLVVGYLDTFNYCRWHLRTQTGVKRFNPPPLNLQHFLYCVFAKYTFQALLLYSLYPKFYIGKRYKLYNNFTFCFSFWGTKSPMTLTGVLPLDLTGGLPSPRLPGLAPTTRTLSIVKSWLRLR